MYCLKKVNLRINACTIKFFVYFMGMIFISKLSQIAFWSFYVLTPFLLWYHNLVKRRKVALSVINDILNYYVIFIILVIITALFSAPIYGIKYPMARFVSLLSVYFFIKLSIVDLENKDSLIKAIDGVIFAGFIFTIYLYTFAFNGFVFVLDDIENSVGNKNTAGSILYLMFNLSIIRSWLTGVKKYFFLVSSFFLLSTLFTASLKCLSTAFFIYFYYLFFLRKEFSLRIKIIFIVVILFALPTISFYLSNLLESSNDLQYIFDRFNIMIGNNEAASVQFDVIEGRANLISQTIKLFYDNPIMGIGLENSRVVYETYSHNTYVEILAGGGVVLMIPFLLFLSRILVFLTCEKPIVSILIVIFFCIIYISNALRIYDDVIYIYLLFVIVLSKKMC